MMCVITKSFHLQAAESGDGEVASAGKRSIETVKAVSASCCINDTSTQWALLVG